MSACGGDDDPLADDGTGGSGSEDKGTLVLGGQDFTEMQIMASIYEQLLEDAGYTVETELVSTRKVYLRELQKGRSTSSPSTPARSPTSSTWRPTAPMPSRSAPTTSTRRWTRCASCSSRMA